MCITSFFPAITNNQRLINLVIKLAALFQACTSNFFWPIKHVGESMENFRDRNKIFLRKCTDLTFFLVCQKTVLNNSYKTPLPLENSQSGPLQSFPSQTPSISPLLTNFMSTKSLLISLSSSKKDFENILFFNLFKSKTLK